MKRDVPFNAPVRHKKEVMLRLDEATFDALVELSRKQDRPVAWVARQFVTKGVAKSVRQEAA